MRRAARAAMREQIAFAEIPCPTWRARERGTWLMERLRDEGLRASRDKVGNIIAERPGTGRKHATLIIDAHMDSVFHHLHEIKVTREGKRYLAPGIGDDAAGIANLILVAHMLAKFKVRTAGDIVFVGSVGEEGDGNLRGMRWLFGKGRFKDAWFVSVDGSGATITRRALASWGPRIVVKGPGGHSYGHFGRPNPVHMLARFISKMETIEVNPEDHSVYNATVISGGTAVNAIPDEARLAVNVRSANLKVLAAMVAKVKRFLAEAKAEELEWATRDKWLDVRYSALRRPGGEVPRSHPLVKVAVSSFEAEGLKPRSAVMSTNANMPISLGIPAINIGTGGLGGEVHSTGEWFENAGRGKALAALARMVFALAE